MCGLYHVYVIIRRTDSFNVIALGPRATIPLAFRLEGFPAARMSVRSARIVIEKASVTRAWGVTNLSRPTSALRATSGQPSLEGWLANRSSLEGRDVACQPKRVTNLSRPTFALRATVGNLRVDRARRLEAAGVEPASESTSPRNSTCVSASVFSARREETAKNRRAPASEKSHGLTPRRRPTASLLNGIWPPTTRRGQGRRSLLIKQRERTEYPQLTDVPSD